VAKKIVPDQQSFENVERDYPNESDSKKSLLAQADMLLREHGYVRQSDGTYEKPRQLIRSRVTCHAGSLREREARAAHRQTVPGDGLRATSQRIEVAGGSLEARHDLAQQGKADANASCTHGDEGAGDRAWLSLPDSRPAELGG
jgi:hypothetical protein